MIVHRIKLPVARLNAMTETDRIYFIRLAHFLNETNILHKMVLWSVTTPASHSIEDSAHNSQTMLFAKLLCGKLYEGRRLITFGFKHAPKFSALACDALKNLKTYFAANNLIETIRNQFSFHTDEEPISDLAKDLPVNTDFEFFLCRHNHSTLFYAADLIANAALLNATGESEVERALTKLGDEFTKVYSWYVDFGGECLAVMMGLYFPGSLVDSQIEKVSIDGKPSLRAVSIPFFVEHADL